MPHDSKYTVHDRLAGHDAALLELRQAIKAIALSPGPQGKQGQTGASGADGKNGRDGRDGIDSHVAGPIGPPGRAGHSIRGERGPRGEKGDTVVGPKGEKGDTVIGPEGIQGVPGNVCYIGPAEVEQAVAKVRAELLRFRASMLGRITQEIEDQKKGGKSGHSHLVRLHFEKLLREVQNEIAEQEAKAAL